MRQLLKHARIYDGTGSEPRTGDILLEADRIAQIAPVIDVPADSVIDLQGKSVSSGFIDGHSHNDWFALKRDPLPYFSPFIRQGITTFVAGNCGISAVGFDESCPWLDHIGGGLFGFQDTVGTYGSAQDYFHAVDRRMPCNLALLAGHCTARAAVGGVENRKLTPAEEEKMLSLLETALQQGAAGISLGMMYHPGLFADVEELKKVAALCVKYNKPLTVHPRAESKVSMAYPQLLGRSHLLRAVDELVEISRGTYLKLHYSHAIFVGRNSFRDRDELMRIFDQLRAEGVDVMFDIYNECLGVSVITVILPAWYQGMTPAERNRPLNRLKLAALVRASSLLLGFGFRDIHFPLYGLPRFINGFGAVPGYPGQILRSGHFTGNNFLSALRTDTDCRFMYGHLTPPRRPVFCPHGRRCSGFGCIDFPADCIRKAVSRSGLQWLWVAGLPLDRIRPGVLTAGAGSFRCCFALICKKRLPPDRISVGIPG